ncbi:oligomeric Golgi complex subunit 5-like [Pyrus ussuriensis x Pyrus communis]|uniref:Oligomeric Golgi complex subunit 5-like n=1 Tax=Pyrus ussuriensis x Pyrus communis TaxID=2448454 RepID=A0A5N5FNQ2_9ROSA|nr:oligomeric Golgi complex subunit 5-like [Pyrus ussuriensis x Pyrus communis]
MELSGLGEIKALRVVGGEGSELTGEAEGSVGVMEKIRGGMEILDGSESLDRVWRMEDWKVATKDCTVERAES